MQPATSPRTSSSVSGHSTTNGYSTRQSVASVTCATRAKPPNAMLSLCVDRANTRNALLRSAAVSTNDCSKRSTAASAAATSCATFASRSRRRRRRAHCRRGACRSPAADAASRRQELPALRVVEEVVLQIGIALDDPDVAQHLEEHPRRPAGPALAAQLLQQLPHRRAEQADHDLAIGERRVVVRNLAQSRRLRGRIGGRDKTIGEGIHGSGKSTAAQHPRRGLCRGSRREERHPFAPPGRSWSGGPTLPRPRYRRAEMCGRVSASGAIRACSRHSGLATHAAQSSTTLPLCPDSIVANADSYSPNA